MLHDLQQTAGQWSFFWKCIIILLFIDMEKAVTYKCPVQTTVKKKSAKCNNNNNG